MKKNVVFIGVLIVSILYIFIGNRIVMKDNPFSSVISKNNYTKAKVTRILERREVPVKISDDHSDYTTYITFEAQILSGEHKNNLVIANQNFSTFESGNPLEVKPGDKVYLGDKYRGEFADQHVVQQEGSMQQESSNVVQSAFQSTANAEVTKIVDKKNEVIDTVNITTVTFEAKITSGEENGKVITSSQSFETTENGVSEELKVGDTIQLGKIVSSNNGIVGIPGNTNSEGENSNSTDAVQQENQEAVSQEQYAFIGKSKAEQQQSSASGKTTGGQGVDAYFVEYARTSTLIWLAILFMLLIIVFGRIKGAKTLVSLIFTLLAIFVVFVPAILGGRNIYVWTIITCIFTTFNTILLVYGNNKKSMATALGCIGGVLVAGLLTLILNNVLKLTGQIDDAVYLPIFNSAINVKALIFAGILLGALGAIMDVSIDIASSLYEVASKVDRPDFKTIMKSGLNIGRDIMGTMTNTLILAYIGSSLATVLMLSVSEDTLMFTLNREMVAVEILQAIVGSIGILTTIPLTSLVAATLYKNIEPIKENRRGKGNTIKYKQRV